MAWVRPTKWFGGESPTAAKWNQELRDNMNAHGIDKPFFAGTIGGAGQSIATGTATAITWTTSQDPYTMKSAGTPSRISAPTAWPGLYFVTGYVPFAANATGIRRVEIKTSRATAPTSTISSHITVNTYVLQQCWLNYNGFVLLSGSDYITVEAFQNSGASNTLSSLASIQVMYVGENEWA